MSWQRGSDPGAERLEETLDAHERAELVERLRVEVEAGTYHVPADDVAESLLRFYDRSLDSEPEEASD